MELKISEGITLKQIEELITYSTTDNLILKNTRDSFRFKNKSSVNNWLKKDRSIYVLTNKQGNLLGIVWFGPKEIPSADFIKDFDPSPFGLTFSIRLYGQARGKGLSADFFNNAFFLYKKTPAYKTCKKKGLWLVSHLDNTPGISLYKKLGFRKVAEDEEKNKLIMTKE